MPPPRNFGPEVQYFNEFLKKDYLLFVLIVIQNEKVFFLKKNKVISSHTTAGFTRAFCPSRGLRELSPLSVLKCWDINLNLFCAKLPQGIYGTGGQQSSQS